jgi:hypothetical protein
MAKWPPIESAYSSRSSTKAEADLSRSCPTFARAIQVLTTGVMLYRSRESSRPEGSIPSTSSIRCGLLQRTKAARSLLARLDSSS